jgi:hypothetical protein
MKANLIERDMQDRERALQSCKGNIMYLQQKGERKYKEDINMLSQEIFFLQDQLSRYKIIFDLLKEEEGPADEMLKKF